MPKFKEIVKSLIENVVGIQIKIDWRLDIVQYVFFPIIRYRQIFDDNKKYISVVDYKKLSVNYRRTWYICGSFVCIKYHIYQWMSQLNDWPLPLFFSNYHCHSSIDLKCHLVFYFVDFSVFKDYIKIWLICIPCVPFFSFFLIFVCFFCVQPCVFSSECIFQYFVHFCPFFVTSDMIFLYLDCICVIMKAFKTYVLHIFWKWKIYQLPLL